MVAFQEKSMIRYGWPLVAVLILAALVAWGGQRPIADDASYYFAMASHPFSGDLTHAPPYCWRILTPLLVFIFPLPPASGFWVVTLVGLAAAALPEIHASPRWWGTISGARSKPL